MESSCRISESALDVNIVWLPVPMAQEASIIKNRKRRIITVRIYPLIAVFGDNGHLLPEPMEWWRNAPFVSIG
jgi:hypothetical protein